MRKSFIYIRRINKLDQCEKKGCNKPAKYIVQKAGSNETSKRCERHAKDFMGIQCVNCGCWLDASSK